MFSWLTKFVYSVKCLLHTYRNITIVTQQKPMVQTNNEPYKFEADHKGTHRRFDSAPVLEIISNLKKRAVFIDMLVVT